MINIIIKDTTIKEDIDEKDDNLSSVSNSKTISQNSFQESSHLPDKMASPSTTGFSKCAFLAMLITAQPSRSHLRTHSR